MSVSRKRCNNAIELSDNSDTSSTGYPGNGFYNKFNKQKLRNRRQCSIQKKLSPETQSNSTSRSDCINKNAIMARENRIRKKLYIENLENDVQRFKKEHDIMKTTLEKKDFVINELRIEVKYLKSLLSNTKEIGILLKNIKSSTGLPVTTTSAKSNENLLNSIWNESDFPLLHSSVAIMPLLSNTEARSTFYDDLFLPGSSSLNDVFNIDLDEPQLEIPSLNYSDNTCSSDIVTSEDDVGVCLHVSGKKVALEFCSRCNSNAQEAWKRENMLLT